MPPVGWRLRFFTSTSALSLRLVQLPWRSCAIPSILLRAAEAAASSSREVSLCNPGSFDRPSAASARDGISGKAGTARRSRRLRSKRSKAAQKPSWSSLSPSFLMRPRTSSRALSTFAVSPPPPLFHVMMFTEGDVHNRCSAVLTLTSKVQEPIFTPPTGAPSYRPGRSRTSSPAGGSTTSIRVLPSNSTVTTLWSCTNQSPFRKLNSNRLSRVGSTQRWAPARASSINPSWRYLANPCATSLFDTTTRSCWSEDSSFT
mmetsp:Transcript_52573/g.139563  ORF Transcript_52573/g.139563 Transcript_52573/m.139563 type:complete len:259 (+) Transcript_52573:918-1694(+)